MDEMNRYVSEKENNYVFEWLSVYTARKFLTFLYWLLVKLKKQILLIPITYFLIGFLGYLGAYTISPSITIYFMILFILPIIIIGIYFYSSKSIIDSIDLTLKPSEENKLELTLLNKNKTNVSLNKIFVDSKYSDNVTIYICEGYIDKNKPETIPLTVDYKEGDEYFVKIETHNEDTSLFGYFKQNYLRKEK